MKRAALLLILVAAPARPQEIDSHAPGSRVSPDQRNSFGQPGPKIVKKVEPEYTKEAAKKKIEGVVVLNTTIGVDGVPADIKVEKTLDHGLDRKAIECLRKWRFSPALRDQGPIPTTVRVEMNFRLLTPKKSN